MTQAAYGTWRSPISAALVGAGSFRLGNMQIQVDGGDVYWTDSRPTERGRVALMRRRADGVIEEVTGPDINVRTAVHEYGGGAFAVQQGILVYANHADQQLYRQTLNPSPQKGGESEASSSLLSLAGKGAGGLGSSNAYPITQGEGLRYADMAMDVRRGRLIGVREDHTGGGRETDNTLVSIPLDGSGAQTVLVQGADFYASPRLSPDGARLAYLAWQHPHMPWDGTELWVADVLADGSLGPPALVAGGPTESIFQPEWSPNGVLHFVADPTGWWNLYRWHDGQVEALHPMAAEFGLPQWSFGMSTYAFLSADRLVCAYAERGLWRLATLDTTTGEFTAIETPYTDIVSVRAQPLTPQPPLAHGERGGQGQAYFAAASPTEPPVLACWDAATGALAPIYQPVKLNLAPEIISHPEVLEFPTTGGLTAFGFYYPPTNPEYTGPTDEKPPLIVLSHGGPTGQTTSRLDLNIQFWTSRGFGVLDVNYGGSTGYGRAYRERLNGQWGVVDVDDCCNGALYLARQGRVDPERLIIRGGSAGGYTTLNALTFRDVFKAGASYYGISDQELLDEETHKFESRYNHSMIGPYPTQKDTYRARSSIHHVDQLTAPMIFFQGGLDKIVLPSQAEAMVAALRAKGIPVAYILFEDEGHGFRQAANVQRALNAELLFYARIFGFDLPEPVEAVHIDNLS